MPSAWILTMFAHVRIRHKECKQSQACRNASNFNEKEENDKVIKRVSECAKNDLKMRIATFLNAAIQLSPGEQRDLLIQWHKVKHYMRNKKNKNKKFRDGVESSGVCYIPPPPASGAYSTCVKRSYYMRTWDKKRSDSAKFEAAMELSIKNEAARCVFAVYVYIYK